MYILPGRGLGQYTPWRARMGLRSKPQYLRFLSLDNFGINESSLKKHHMDLLDSILVKTVEASWKSMQPIDLIRLIGHTDITGPEAYNVGLGDRRARAVEEALRDKLRGFISRVAIVVEASPGKSEPTADNRTPEGRARNRRVEVFIASGGLPPKPSKTPVPPIPPIPPGPAPDPDPYRWQRGMPPGRPDRSLKERLIDLCSQHFPARACPEMVNRILSGSCSALEALISRAGATLSEKQREDLRQQCRDAASGANPNR
jgi:OmpA family protein